MTLTLYENPHAFPPEQFLYIFNTQKSFPGIVIPIYISIVAVIIDVTVV